MPYFPSSARAKDAEDVEEAEDDIGVPDQGDNHIPPPLRYLIGNPNPSAEVKGDIRCMPWDGATGGFDGGRCDVDVVTDDVDDELKA